MRRIGLLNFFPLYHQKRAIRGDSRALRRCEYPLEKRFSSSTFGRRAMRMERPPSISGSVLRLV